jgi:hypothetical protein
VKVILKGGTYNYNPKFIVDLAKGIKEGRNEIFNPYDNCFIFLDSIYEYEDENGKMIKVK